MKELKLAKEKKDTITIDKIDCDKHIVIGIFNDCNAVLRGNNEKGYSFVFSDGSGRLNRYSTIQHGLDHLGFTELKIIEL